MKSNEKYVFSLIYYRRRCLAAKCKILVEHARRLGSHDYFDIIYSTCRLVYNMDEWRICEKPEFNGLFYQVKMETGRF